MAEMSAMNRKLIQNLAETLSKHVKHWKFRNILHNTFGMTDDMIMDRVFCAFDKDNDSYVSVKEWIEGLSVFLHGALDKKKSLRNFDVYDLGTFPRKRCSTCGRTGIKDLVVITLMKMVDHDSRLSYADLEKDVRDENLLLDAFGTCLHDAKSILAFEQHAFQDPLEH
uniref:Calaxin n=1 Tax=Salmo trutta TaxID=8032 RepID=A0A674E6U1_SALTR